MTPARDAKTRGILLKELRLKHNESVTRTQALLKDQKAVRKQICQTMRDSARSVPEIAELVGMPAGQVLWHVMAMKKYGLVSEQGMCGEYYLYQMAENGKR
jgi:predicted transcriptional regulator